MITNRTYNVIYNNSYPDDALVEDGYTLLFESLFVYNFTNEHDQFEYQLPVILLNSNACLITQQRAH